jgi:hypothetical protein
LSVWTIDSILRRTKPIRGSAGGDELSVERLPVEKHWPGLALRSTGRDEVEVEVDPSDP